MTSPANQQNPIPATNTTASTANSYASAAGAPKKPAQAPVVAPGSRPPVAVGSSASSAQNAKAVSSSSPVNGKPAVTPAVPAVVRGSSVNGSALDHSRKSSVTMAANGPSGYVANGGSIGGAKSGIQFGYDSPAMAHSIPHVGQSAPIPIPGGNQRVPSPAHSPSPIPQPSASGGRPPSSLQQPAGQMTFGSLPSDGDRHMRQGSVPSNPNALGSQPNTHFRRESSHSVQSDNPAGPNRANFPPQGGRGRGNFNPHATQFNNQMGFPPNNQFRSGPNQSRGMPPAFQPSPRNMPYPNSPQPARSPALVPSMPNTPNMPPATMQPNMSMQTPPQYHYPPPMAPQHQQVQFPFPAASNKLHLKPHNNKKIKGRREHDKSFQTGRHVDPARELYPGDVLQHQRRSNQRADSLWREHEKNSMRTVSNGTSMSSSEPHPIPVLNRPSNDPAFLDLSPENGGFELWLTLKHQNFGYPPQQMDQYGRPISVPYGYGNMPYMGPPQTNSPGYNQQFVPPPYHQQSHSMSRSPSQPERPSSASQSTQPVIVSSNPQVQNTQGKPSSSFIKPRKSAAVQIKNLAGEVVDTSTFKQPASPVPSIQYTKTPPVASTPTPPNKPSTPSHVRTESQATPKTAKEIQDELKAKIKQATRAALEHNKPKEGEKEEKTEAKIEIKPEVKLEAKPEMKPEAKPEVKTEVKPEVKTEVKPEMKPEAKPEVKTEVKPEMKPEAKPEVKTEVKPEMKPEAKPEVKTEVKPEMKPEAKPEVKAEVKPEVKREAKEEPTELNAESQDEPTAKKASSASEKSDVAKVEVSKKVEEEKSAEPTKDANPEDDEIERMIREMEEADARREKQEEEHRKKKEAEKAAAEKLEGAQKQLSPEERDRKLRDQEREMEILDEEREKKKREQAESTGKSLSVSEALAQARGGNNQGNKADDSSNAEAVAEKKLADNIEGDKPASSTEPAGQKEKRVLKPAALNLTPINTKSVEPPQPSAALQSLKSARFLHIMDQEIYPAGIKSPNPALNAAVAKKGKTFKYDAVFLLQFQKVFTEQPSLQFHQQIKSLIGDGDGGRSASRGQTPSSARQGSRGGSVAFPGGAFNAPPGRTLPPGTTSNERLAIANGAPRPQVNPMASFQRPGGAFPGGTSMSRTSSQNMRNNMPNSPRQSSRSTRGSRRNDNAKEAQAAKTMPLTAGIDVKPIVVSATGWKPSSVGAKTVAQPVQPGQGYLDPEMVQRKVKAALNKMTPEKFDRIADQILLIASQSKDESDGRTLRQVIQLTFEKATDEAHWASMYAKFCKRMLETMSADIRDESIKDKNGNIVSGGNLFRKYLLNRCQEEFERGWTSHLPELKEADDGDKRLGDTTMLSDEYYQLAAAKRRGLGLVQFIGELFKLGMLTERIMHECVHKLVDYKGVPDEAEIESLVKLLRTIGANLDETDKGRPAMDVYFQRIRTMADVPDLPSRLRFMLMDVVDLRRARWVSKEANKGPKTLEEVRVEAEAAQAAKAQEAARSNTRGGGGRPPVGRGDARNFSGNYTQQPSNQVAMDDLRRLKGSIARTSSANVTLGPTAMFSSRSNSGRRLGPGGSLGRPGDDSNGSSRTGTPGPSHSNAFSLLANMDNEHPASPPSAGPSPLMSKAVPASDKKDGE